MNSSSEAEVAPTKDTVLALMEFLVDPLLPSKSHLKKTVSPSQEELMAKQMHAVVLLYNYHHRKQHPSLPHLEFQVFCKLAMDMKPSLKLYFGLMQRTNYAELDDLDKHLSLTEKAIMNACDTSKILFESNTQIIEGWPINKVAVFLVDTAKENCYLFHGSITQGVWSVIEKEVDALSQGSEAASNKKNRVIKKAPKENQTVDETTLLQLAYSAVKESCGIDESDLEILEYHSVYSTSKEKKAVRLFIMQCTQTDHDAELIPINDVMDSLQGPLVRKEAVSWIFTPVVEYFHLLPFADKVSNWFMRENAAIEAGNCNSSHTRVEIENITGSHSIKKPLVNNSEQNCASPFLKEGTSLNTSEATKEFRDGNSCQLKEGSITFPPKFGEASEARDNISSRLEEPPLYTSQPVVAVKEASEAAKGIRNGNSYNLRNEPLQYVSRPRETLEVARKINSIDLNNEPLAEVEREVIKQDSCSSLRVLRAEPVVYRKRNRSQKNSSSCINSVNKTTNAPKDYPKVQEQSTTTASSNKMDIDEPLRTWSPINEKSSVQPHENCHHNQELMVIAQETDQVALAGGAIVVGEFPITSKEKVSSDNKISDTATSDQDEKQDCSLVPLDSNFEHLRKIQLTIDSKEKLISQTALKNLFRKKEQLTLQLRSIADEISLCDRSIQTILLGGEDDFAVKIDSILEGCNEICMKSTGSVGDKTALQIQDRQDFPPPLKRKKLSEADLTVHNPCQELDGICNENFWMLPTYSVSTSEGGFQAIVTVKGVDFECSSEGAICTTPLESRKSAALKILTKLRSMAAEL